MDSLNSSRNPSSVTTVPGFNQSHADSIISSLLSFPDSSSTSIASSFNGVLDKSLASVSDDDSVQDRLVDRTLKLASLLLESTKRCHRKRDSVHNSHSWFLPPKLTIKIFSMLDTKSLMQATACCTMFNKCARDPLCYSNIDLTTSAKHADDGAVCTMIHRAGNELRSLVTIVLELHDPRFEAWKELFLIHCQAFDVAGHLDGTAVRANVNDHAWIKKDGQVKSWIYGTLSKEMLDYAFKPGSTTKEVWDRIEAFFNDNKEARAIQLDHELRSKSLDDLSIHTYAQQMKSISDQLAAVDAPVSERNLVTFLLNGLDDKYEHIINVIKFKEPFPTFDKARSMLLLEEDRLRRNNKTPQIHRDTSSSEKVLLATSQTPAAPQAQQKTQNNKGQKKQNQSRGRGRGNYNNQYHQPNFQPWNAPYWNPATGMWQFPQYNPWMHFPMGNNQQGVLGPRPSPPPQPAAHNVSNQYDQAAYNTMTMIDPTDHQWYMDSGATTHLSNGSGSGNSTETSPQ